MSQFEFLLALYAIVAGLGLSLLVRSIGQMIEARDRVRMYWVHTCWIAIAFIGHVVSWFVLWGYVAHQPWTVLQALLLLCVPILLYLISHLAVPELEDGVTHDMRTYLPPRALDSGAHARCGAGRSGDPRRRRRSLRRVRRARRAPGDRCHRDPGHVQCAAMVWPLAASPP